MSLHRCRTGLRHATKDTGYTAVGLALVSETAAGVTRPARRRHRRDHARHRGLGLGGGRIQVAVISDLLEGGNPAGRVRQYLQVAASVTRI